MTDDFKSYYGLEREFAGHQVIKHSRKNMYVETFIPIQLKVISAY